MARNANAATYDVAADLMARVPTAVRTLEALAKKSTPGDSVRLAAARTIVEYALKLRAERPGENGDLTLPEFPVLRLAAGGKKPV